MNLQVEPPEKISKKRKKTSNSPPPPSSSPPSPASSSPSFSLLPDEITVNCLARISRSYYPNLSIVSKSFRSLLSSTELNAARSHLKNTEQCLYVCLRDRNFPFPQWFRLWINPNRTLPDSSMIKKKKTIRQLLVPIPSSNFPSLSRSIVSVGSEIYVIGGPVDEAPSSAVRILDCRSHTWRDAPSMNVAREYAASCVHDGKIYVLGGCRVIEDDQPWAEVFNTKTQTWECLPDPGTEVQNVRLRKFWNIPETEEMEGKIYFGPVYKMYAYDTKQGKWECCENKSASFPWSQCVIENVRYFYLSNDIWWCNINDGCWKLVKGLDSLREKHMMRNGGSSDSRTKLVSCGGKLLLTWEEYMKRKKKIWCAGIGLEKRDGGEVWGNVEWVDVVHTVPTSCQLLHCLAVSV